MTRAAESGIAPHTLRDLLGHKTAAMADRYIRRANLPVVDATEAVSGALAAMMDGLEATQRGALQINSDTPQAPHSRKYSGPDFRILTISLRLRRSALHAEHWTGIFVFFRQGPHRQ